MSYKPGDKVWVTVVAGHSTLPTGDLPAVILSGPTSPYNNSLRFPGPWREIDIESYPSSGYPSYPWRAPEAILRPRHDPYEGDQAGSWGSCPYTPQKVLV
jgi:hypothetical protein